MYGRGYDIITPANMEDVEVKSWFDVKQGEPCLLNALILWLEGDAGVLALADNVMVGGNALVAGELSVRRLAGHRVFCT